MVNRWWRGVAARVVLGLAIVVATCGCFGATFEARGAETTRGIHVLNLVYNLRILFPLILTRISYICYEVPGGP